MTVPDLGDALPGAEWALDRGVQAARSGADAAVQPHLVALLEAAGGPDVGNAVRAHLERSGRSGPGDRGTGRWSAGVAGTADAVLDAAYALHCAAQSDLRSALTASGLGSGLAEGDRRRARAEHAATALAARDAAVRAVLDRLRAR